MACGIAFFLCLFYFTDLVSSILLVVRLSESLSTSLLRGLHPPRGEGVDVATAAATQSIRIAVRASGMFHR
ncbi:hypothetical protein BJ912DRAFT_983630 [Pholiota molesta]|nr:hypothetical protein BJ912DRAFT_983630 [Pholiota molesta]